MTESQAPVRPSCPVCGGQVKPGWTVHPACASSALDALDTRKDPS